MVLKIGSKGDAVRCWQSFLKDLGLLARAPDGIFGEKTQRATLEFQKAHGLEDDGVADADTLRVAEEAGFLGIGFFPSKPAFRPVQTSARRRALFGKIAFVRAPTAGNPEAIRITNDWKEKNIVPVEVPQLVGTKLGWCNKKCKGTIYFHKLAAEPLKAMFRDWEAKGLLRRLLSFDGGYAPRFTRGSKTVLSPHAFGSAVDLNAEWNKLRKAPAPLGAKGSVLELVQIANAHGFYWGGHFSGRKDGMHFEIAQLPS